MELPQDIAAKVRSLRTTARAICFILAACFLSAWMPPVPDTNEPGFRTGSIVLAHGDGNVGPTVPGPQAEDAPPALARLHAGWPALIPGMPLRTPGMIESGKPSSLHARDPPACRARLFAA